MPNYAGRKVTERVFDAVKLLLECGSTANEVAKYMGMSNKTIGIINKAENFDEYRSLMYEDGQRYWNKKRAIEAKEAAKKQEEKKPEEPPVQVVEHRQTVTVQATWAMTQEMQKTNKLLELISNKLAFIVDELTGMPGKGGEKNV